MSITHYSIFFTKALAACSLRWLSPGAGSPGAGLSAAVTSAYSLRWLSASPPLALVLADRVPTEQCGSGNSVALRAAYSLRWLSASPSLPNITKNAYFLLQPPFTSSPTSSPVQLCLLSPIQTVSNLFPFEYRPPD